MFANVASFRSSTRGPPSSSLRQLPRSLGLLLVAIGAACLDTAAGFTAVGFKLRTRGATMADMIHEAQAGSGKKRNGRLHAGGDVPTMAELLSPRTATLQDLPATTLTTVDLRHTEVNLAVDNGKAHGGAEADHLVWVPGGNATNLTTEDPNLQKRMDEIWDSAESLREEQRHNETYATLKDIDVDGDGVISMKEAQKLRDDHSAYGVMMQLQRFRAADVNKDRVLQHSELHAFLHADLEAGVDFREFRRLENAGGLEVVDEEAAEQEFQLHDENGDGLLNRAEFDSLIAGHQLFRPRPKPRKLLASPASRGDLVYEGTEMNDAIHRLLNQDFENSYFGMPMKGILRSEV